MTIRVIFFTLMGLGYFISNDLIGQDIKIDPTRVYEGSNNILLELRPKVVNPYSQFYYIEDRFYSGNILLFDSSKIENLPIRYDIMRNRLEILFQNETKVLYARKIISFEWFNTDQSRKSVFVNTQEYDPKDLEITGFFEILAKGKLSLLSQSSLTIHTGTSSVSVSGSHRSNNIFRKENYFLLKDNQVFALPAKRGYILELMQDQKDEVVKFVRKKGLLFKRKKDLIAIFEYYNSFHQ